MTTGGSSRSSRGLVLVLVAAVIVVGAGAAGWFLFSKSEPAVEPTPTAEPRPTTSRPAPALDPASTVTSRGSDGSGDGGSAGSALPTREYVVNGVKVRDHRPEGTPEWQGTPQTKPTDTRTMRSASTSMLSKAIQLVMRECTQTIPPEERAGSVQKMEASFTIAVKDKVATVTKATVTLKDASGPATDAARACIETKVLAVTEGVDEDDLEGYGISTSLRF